MARNSSLAFLCTLILHCCSLVLANAIVSTPKRSLNFDRIECQIPTKNPLAGCPKGTVLVGPGSTYSTIQSAIKSLRNDSSEAVILILPGNYTEQVNVTRSGPVYLLGQTSHPKEFTKNAANVLWAATAGTGDNAYTATLTVASDLDAALTGSGTTGHTM